MNEWNILSFIGLFVVYSGLNMIGFWLINSAAGSAFKFMLGMTIIALSIFFDVRSVLKLIAFILGSI